ncbi:MAG: hypothetical protein IKN43_05795 [Selenomonadaceae bacterium]|nr:hypothetical protein [Selenomonadaceae bacterium]
MLYSFDVFDTLITRKTATPKGIFALMQHKLQTDAQYFGINEFLRNNFFDIRVNAEELARLNYFHQGIEEISLEQIYEAVGTIGFVDESAKITLSKLEKTIETESVVGIKRNIDKVKSLAASRDRVILISDMYLDEETIRKMLISVDGIFTDIPIYVSSQYKKGKWSSGLFHLVREKESVEFSDWVHTGDNEHSDINVPKSIGIKIQPFKFAAFLPLEEKMLDTGEDRADTQLMIGVARNLRVEENMSVAESVGSSFAGYILFPYIHWLLEQCRQMDIRRLYFIARDGYVLKKIADIIINNRNISIETHYIYASRRSLRMPAYDGTEENFRKILTYSNPLNIKSIRAFARTLRIDVESLLSFLPDHFCCADKMIDYKTVCYIAQYLGKNEEFRRFLVEYHKEAKELTQAYLLQEVDCSDEQFAFVDLNGSGLSANSLCNLMNKHYAGKVKTFFFQLNRMGLEGNGLVYNFCPGTYKYDLVLELLCRALHGQTEYYKKEFDKIVPVLKGKEGEALEKYGYKQYLNGIQKFTKNYALLVIKFDMHISLSFSLKCLHYAVDDVDADLMNYIAETPFSCSGRSGELAVFAPKLTKQEIRNIFLLHRGDFLEKYYNGVNFEYSLLRCSDSERKKIKFYDEHWSEIIRRLKAIRHSATNEEFEWQINKCMNLLLYMGNRILLYGAGNFGKALCSAFKNSDKEVVAWLDKDFEKLRACGYPVVGNINETKNIEHDAIFIAIIDFDVVKEVKKRLIDNGENESRIFSIYDEEVDYLHYLDM